MIFVVIPTYNRAEVISNIMDNLLAQTCPEWQCIIVDDYSTDNTKFVVRQYAAKDARFVYLVNHRSKGAQGARNTGILAADGEWICLFDSDDVMYPNYIERMHAEIEKGSADIYASYANIRSIQTGQLRGKLDKIVSDNLHEQLLKEQAYVAYDVCVIRRQKLMVIGLLDENCPSMQEWDTHIRLSRNSTYSVIPEPLCEWIVDGDDAITQDIQKHLKGMLYIYAKHRHDFRRYAYRHYLNALSSMWTQIEKPWRLLRLAPELLVYKPLKNANLTMISPKLRCIREYNRIYRYLLRWLWKLQGRDAARVYMFHSVVDTPDQVYSQFAITKDSFERFIRYELQRGQKPMNAETMKKAVDNPDAYKNHFLVTFDDIYDSVYTNSYPILKENNVPFLLFVTPALIDNVDPKSKHPMITMEHLQEMAKDPLCIIGAHGMNHVAFRTLTEEQAYNSMIESKRWIENTFGKPVNFFAFPFGRRVEVSNANIRTLSMCDFQCGFSALDGSLKQKWFSGRWFLPRILVDDKYVNDRVRELENEGKS